MTGGPRILIVEDEVLTSSQLAEVLIDAGYGVVGPVASGEDAVRKGQETLPDLVLMDIRLKGRMDGIETASLLRAQIDVPIVYLTAHAEKDLVERAKATEPYAYISKSVSPQSLISTVEMALYRHGMEKRLRENEQRLELVLEAANVGVWDFNVETGECVINLPSGDMLGYMPEEISPHFDLWRRFIHTDDLSRVMSLFNAHLEGALPVYEAEYRMRAKSGEWRWILSRGRVVLRDAMGKPLRVIGTHADITDRKRNEEEIRAERDKAQQYLDIVGVMVVALDTAGTVTLINRKGSELLGWSHGEIVGKNWFDHFLPQAIRGEVKDMFTLLTSGDLEPTEYHENPVLTRSGEQRLIAWHNILLRDQRGAIVGTLSSGEDITDRKHAEKELLASQTLYQALFNDSKDGVYAVTREGEFLDANQSFLDVFGYARKEIIGSKIQDLYVAPSDRMTFQEAIEATGSVKDYELTLRHKSGRPLHCLVTSTLSRSPVGDILGYQGILRDVSDQKRAKEERLRLVTAVEQADESIMITDTQGTIQYVNPAFERTTGYLRKETIGQNPRILKSGKQGPEFYRQMWETINSGKVWRGHFINAKRDGTLYEEEATISPIKEKSGKVVNFVGVKRDVTNEVMLQKQLIQAQRMEAVGNLAGGIAHDFNNLLQVILGFADVLLFGKRLGEHGHEELQTIRKAAKDGSALVKQILTLSRKVETHQRPTNLNEVVKRVEKLLYRTIPKMIEIELHLPDHLRTTNADPGQMEQVLLNLTVNATDAMPEGGKLIIETGNITLDEEYCMVHLHTKPGDYVVLTVSDTGHGMSPEVVERAFEPFYSTKKPGEGTGLGLAMVFGIVKNHGGQVTCYSEPGVGTTFKIYLPAVQTVEAAASVTQTAVLRGGTETILLVDDEDKVRNIAARILSMAGYTVLRANSGPVALQLFQEHREDISLVILDLIMPGMGGRECLEKLLDMDPKAQVLISSGFSVNGPTKETLEAGSIDFLGKPYDAEQLLTKVRNLLDAKQDFSYKFN